MRILPRKHVLQYDWLVHFYALSSLAFPALFIFSEPTSNPWQLAILYPLFIVQWYHGFWQNDKHAYGHFIALSLLACWALTMHWSGVLIFFYNQHIVLKFQQIWYASIMYLVQTFLFISLSFYLQFDLSFIIGSAMMIFFGGHANYLYFKHIGQQLNLIRTQDEIEYLSRERERERIARDLHDVLGHKLSSIALKSELAERFLEADSVERAKKELSEIAETARTALADVRQTVTGYRSGNLRSELSMAENTLQSAGITFQMPEKLPVRISREMENLLSILLRESVTNIIRHAHAANCRIQLFNKNRQWNLVVTDDGIGWNGKFGNGLLGMKERLAVYNGKLKVQNLEPGTQLILNVNQLLEGDVHEKDVQEGNDPVATIRESKSDEGESHEDD